MQATERIIRLIEQGDPIPILAEASLVDTLNELLKYQLVDIIENKVVLTSKGEEARILGLDKVINQIRIDEELKDFSTETQQKEKNVFQLCLWLCLSLVTLFLALVITNENLF